MAPCENEFDTPALVDPKAPSLNPWATPYGQESVRVWAFHPRPAFTASLPHASHLGLRAQAGTGMHTRMCKQQSGGLTKRISSPPCLTAFTGAGKPLK